MANAVIISNTNRIQITFNDMSSIAGIASADWQKASVSLEMNYSDSDIFVRVTEGPQLRFSYNSQIIVDSVNGTTPVSNANLLSLLQTATTAQVITVSTTAPSSPNLHDLWIEIP